MYGAAVSLVDALSSLWDIKLSAEVCRTRHVTMPAREFGTSLTLHGAEITSFLCVSVRFVLIVLISTSLKITFFLFFK